jgi:hypothetical protein
MKHSTNVSEKYVASIFKGEAETRMKPHADILLGVFFNSEDGGDMFLGNIS